MIREVRYFKWLLKGNTNLDGIADSCGKFPITLTDCPVFCQFINIPVPFHFAAPLSVLP
ncbi:hypothetical protein HH682_09785 [Rosenbergiella sp. S61]|uniref:Uncharacterized protein n=1 Tax=Rosenbergiella gaditana TaxID=2726987 RepID=A0ABS5SXJ1_9GAMM|nr:hypothetical protein [Rosenbergiella gaditana]MBT0724716.1 hypothetical protein [Rosenbergiella gaditana]